MEYFYSFVSDLFHQIFVKKVKPFFIPHQPFSLPLPLIRHILINGILQDHLKLFKSCKLFRNYFRKIHGFQVNNLCLRNHRKMGKEYYLEKRSLHLCYDFLDHKIQRPISSFVAFKPKRLRFSTTIWEDEDYMVLEISKKLDFSILKKVHISFFVLNAKVLLPLLVPSLLCLELLFDEVSNGNILETVLLNAPNLKHLAMPWRENGISLEQASKIRRSKKLNWIVFYIPVCPQPADVANFIFHQIEPMGRLKLFGPYYHDTFEPPLNFEKDVLQLLKSKTDKYDKFTVVAKRRFKGYLN